MRLTSGRPLRAFVIVLIVGVLSAVAGGVARADFTLPRQDGPLDTSSCPGFAPDFAAFADPVFFSDTFPPDTFFPASQYVIVQLFEDVHPIAGQTNPDGSFDEITRIAGLDLSGVYTLSGTFHEHEALPGPPAGTGMLRITRDDGARMWGEAAFEIASHRGDYLRISFTGSTHCSLR
jgi:hypothetical protein